MSKRSQPLTADTPICEHDLTLEQPLTLDQLAEWDLQFTRFNALPTRMIAKL